MKAKLVKESLDDLLKPKSEEDIVNYINNLNQEEKDKNLIDAAYNGQTNVIKLLIESGADINAKNIHGNTALIFASARGYLDIVKYLIEVGADINLKNNLGNTALMYAYNDKYKEIIELLKKHGAYRLSKKLFTRRDR